MSTCGNRVLRPEEASALLAEAAYMGRNLGHALRGPHPVTEEEAAVHYPYLFEKIRLFAHKAFPGIQLDDLSAAREVARLHFKWRMTDTHPEEDV